jgi:hypothetical protein
VWDLVLGQGQRVWGLAVDDAHHFQSFGADRANPGRGWVAVNAGVSTEHEILDALARGDFYASTGASILDLRKAGKELIATVDEPSLIEFVGDGETIESTFGTEARVRLGRWGYVRGRVSNERGVAWIQPHYE